MTHDIFTIPGWSSALVCALAVLAALLSQSDAGPMSWANQRRLAEALWMGWDGWVLIKLVHGDNQLVSSG